MLYAAFANVVLTPGIGITKEGYLQSFNASDLAQRNASFQVTPTGLKGGIWQAGRGLSVDAKGNVYLATAGGEYNGIDNFGTSILKFASSTPTLVDVAHFFDTVSEDAVWAAVAVQAAPTVVGCIFGLPGCAAGYSIGTTAASPFIVASTIATVVSSAATCTGAGLGQTSWESCGNSMIWTGISVATLPLKITATPVALTLMILQDHKNPLKCFGLC